MGSNGRKIYVGNLPAEVDEAAFKTYFEQFGEITGVKLLESKEVPGQCRGFGFITYKEAAAASLATAGEHQYSGQQLKVNIVQNRPKKYFLQYGHLDINESILREHFQQHGTIQQLTVKPAKNIGWLTIIRNDERDLTLLPHVFNGKDNAGEMILKIQVDRQSWNNKGYGQQWFGGQGAQQFMPY